MSLPSPKFPHPQQKSKKPFYISFGMIFVGSLLLFRFGAIYYKAHQQHEPAAQEEIKTTEAKITSNTDFPHDDHMDEKTQMWHQYPDLDGMWNDSAEGCHILADIPMGKNFKAALKEIKEKAEAGNPIAQCQIGYAYSLGIGGVSADRETAMTYYLKAAEQGDADAQFNYALLLPNKTPAEVKQKLYWYEKSADQGNFKAEFNLASNLKESPKRTDREKAIELFKDISQKGDPWADYWLGVMYIGNGINVKKPEKKEGKDEDWKQAAFYFQKAYDAGFYYAGYELGMMYQTGHGVPTDFEKRTELWQKAADIGEKQAQGVLGATYLFGQAVPQNTDKAIDLLTKAAAQGHGESAAQLGTIYSSGRYGVKKDMAKAVHFWEIALNNGIEEVRFNLAYAYEKGIGVPQDDEKSVQMIGEGLIKGNPIVEYMAGITLLKHADSPEEEADAAQYIHKAAEHNLLKAQLTMADLYRRGQGVPKNLEEAEKWQKKADKGLKQKAKSGDAEAMKALGDAALEDNPKKAAQEYRHAAQSGDDEAQYRLGALYFQGQGVKKNTHLAVSWWKKSAEQKNIEAIMALAGLYANGEQENADTPKPIKQNFKMAAKYYQQGADLHNADAENALGQLYAMGKGVRKNPKEAVKLWEKAAQNDNTEAQYHLAEAYKSGQGVKANAEQADYWYQKAAASGMQQS